VRAASTPYVEPRISRLRQALDSGIPTRAAKVALGAAAVLALALLQSRLLWSARDTSSFVPARHASIAQSALRQPVEPMPPVEPRTRPAAVARSAPPTPVKIEAARPQAAAPAPSRPAPPRPEPPRPEPPRSARAAQARVQPAIHVAAQSTRPLAPERAASGDTAAIRSVLKRYGTAFSGLDAQAVSEVWPTVDTKALDKTFDALQTQAVSFDTCDISVTVGAAAASCQGTLRYVKVGSRSSRSERHIWQFSLRKGGEGWVISRVQSR